MTVPTGFTQRITDAAFRSPTLGPPGVYFTPAVPVDYLAVESMDVAGFVGVAPRGPAWVTTTDPDVNDGNKFRARSVATPVDSWDDYVELFGGFEDPGLLLPYAVSAYFAQGGRRAYIVRVVHKLCPLPAPSQTPPGCAVMTLGLDPNAEVQAAQRPKAWLRIGARNEGTWGNRLSVAVQFTHRQLIQLAPDAASVSTCELNLPPAVLVPLGATLRFTPPSPDRRLPLASVEPPQPSYRTVMAIRPVGQSRDLIAQLDTSIDLVPDMTIEVVEADVTVSDADPARPRSETFRGVGLSDQHPRCIVRVLNDESRLVQAEDAEPALLGFAVSRGELISELELLGADRSGDLTTEDMFPLIKPCKEPCNKPCNEPSTTGGLGAIALAEEVATFVVPDLYAPQTLPKVEHPSLAETRSPAFVRCGRPPAPPNPVPEPPMGLRLDPASRDDRETIIGLQRKVIEQAESMRRIVLLDVPPGMTFTQVLAWRASFDSAFAAAYHPWLAAPAQFNQVQPVPPSAVAAGVIAQSELTRGIARGPANEIAVGIVDVETVVPPDDHASLHRLGMNVFQPDTEGIRLTAARTLSSDPAWRQLTVRRLLLSIEKAVRSQLQWVVFEPNDDRLRDSLRRQLNGMLSDLFELGSFAGSTPDESWFVNIASRADAAAEADAGQLIVEIGVAPSEPLEFIIVRVALQAEGDIKSSFTSGLGVTPRA
jgi:Bacteriophage tail sheath protein